MLNISPKIQTFWSTNQRTLFVQTPKPDIYEVEIVPVGETSREKTKISSMLAKYTNTSTHENIPLPGFTLLKSNRKNWGSVDQTWIVIDPRGFLTRITNENLEHILQVSGINEGLIQEKCVWARINKQSRLALIPISSPKYTEAVENTNLIKNKISIRDVQIGDMVQLQNGLKGTYLGTVSLYGPIVDQQKSPSDYTIQKFHRRQVLEIEGRPGKFYYQSDLKILKILNRSASKTTKEDAVAYMNGKIQNNAAFFSTNPTTLSTYFGVYGLIKYVSLTAVPSANLTLEAISLTDATDLFNSASLSGDIGALVLEKDNRKFIVNFPYSGYANVKPDQFSVIEIDIITDKIVTKEKRVLYIFGSNKNKHIFKIDDFSKFYKLVKNIKNEHFI